MNKSSWCIASVRSAKVHDNLLNNEKMGKIKLPVSSLL